MKEGPRSDPGRSELPAAEAVSLADLVDTSDGAVVSRVLGRAAGGTVTAFAFDRGESVDEHTTPCVAFALVLEGQAEFVIEGRRASLTPGQMVLIPAGAPHSVRAIERFKMLLVMLRG